MTLAGFSIQDRFKKAHFYKKIFLLANTSMKVVLEMFFLACSNADFLFGVKKLIWRSYITTGALPMISWIELINKSEVAKAVLNENSETFMIYVTALKDEASIYLLQIASIAALQ